MLPANVLELSELRNRVAVFRDREHAGEVLAALLAGEVPRDGLVLAIPAGGVPVAAVLARRLGLPLDLAVVSKITLPWNTEAGYGAVAFDGTTRLNDDMVRHLGLAQDVVQAGLCRTREKVERRVRRLRAGRDPLDLAERTVVLVDDGLASGFTLRVAAAAVRSAGAERRLVAVPTGHAASVRSIAPELDRLYCANLRGGLRFAVADAYERWCDVSEQEVEGILARHHAGG
jgi:predicted phosphoribosyltransferase